MTRTTNGGEEERRDDTNRPAQDLQSCKLCHFVKLKVQGQAEITGKFLNLFSLGTGNLHPSVRGAGSGPQKRRPQVTEGCRFPKRNHYAIAL